jgi:D-sedoheptulose 7-phosphate isomerase
MERQRMNVVADYIRRSIDVYEAMIADTGILAAIERAAEAAARAILNNRKILFAGNGGSAADAQHFAGELISRFNYERPGMAGIALTTDTSVLTAISNDYGYQFSFSRQVEALGQEGDVFIGISTSGQSANIISALQAARRGALSTIGMTGCDGGAMAQFCDVEIRIPCSSTPLIQQGHLVAGHLICSLIEEAVHPRRC